MIHISSRNILVAILTSVTVACGGGSKAQEKTPALTVAPTEWSVFAGGDPKQFTATLTDSSDPISWVIETAGTAAEVGTVLRAYYSGAEVARVY